MSTEEAKKYLVSRSIPQLFESLMTGLMYYKPENHVQYLQDCLKKLENEGSDEISWKRFIEQRVKTPLPPIPSRNGNLSRENSCLISDAAPKCLEEKRTSPLPPIRSSKSNILPSSCPVVLVIGGPGSRKANLCKRLVDRYIGWEHLSIGELLRHELFNSAQNKLDVVADMIRGGDMAPEEVALEVIKSSVGHLGPKTRGVIIEGYPRTMKQLDAYKENIGRIDAVFLLDCEESKLRQRLLSQGVEQCRPDDNTLAIEKRLVIFKNETLPVVKYFDDRGHLSVVAGDGDEDETFYNLASLFDKIFVSGSSEGVRLTPVPRPPSGAKPRSPRSACSASSRYSRIGSGFRNVTRQMNIGNSDNGRCANLPKFPIIFLLGGPGCGHEGICEQMVESFPGMEHLSITELLMTNISVACEDNCQQIKDIMASGELVADDIIFELLSDFMMVFNNDTKAVVISGFPRTSGQIELFNKKIGGLLVAILLDCDEDLMRQKCLEATQREDSSLPAVNKRISNYKHSTLPVLGYLDDVGKLAVVNIDEATETDVFSQVANILGEKLATLSDEPALDLPEVPEDVIGDVEDGTGGDAAPDDVEDALEVLTYRNSERIEGMPTCPIVAVIGAPPRIVSELTSQMAEALPDIKRIQAKDIELEDLKSEIMNSDGTSAIILENYPSNVLQLEQFNESIGGMSGVITFDASEQYCLSNGLMEDDITKYKTETLPILENFDNLDLLKVVLAEDENRLENLAAAFEHFRYLEPINCTNDDEAANETEENPTESFNVGDEMPEEDELALDQANDEGQPESISQTLTNEALGMEQVDESEKRVWHEVDLEVDEAQEIRSGVDETEAKSQLEDIQELVAELQVKEEDATEHKVAEKTETGLYLNEDFNKEENEKHIESEKPEDDIEDNVEVIENALGDLADQNEEENLENLEMPTDNEERLEDDSEHPEIDTEYTENISEGLFDQVLDQEKDKYLEEQETTNTNLEQQEETEINLEEEETERNEEEQEETETNLEEQEETETNLEEEETERNVEEQTERNVEEQEETGRELGEQEETERNLETEINLEEQEETEINLEEQEETERNLEEQEETEINLDDQEEAGGDLDEQEETQRKLDQQEEMEINLEERKEMETNLEEQTKIEENFQKADAKKDLSSSFKISDRNSKEPPVDGIQPRKDIEETTGYED